MPLGGDVGEERRRGSVAVVECGIQAQLVGQERHLLRGSGRADDGLGPLVLRDLGDDGADGSCGTGDEDDVALLHLGDLDEPDVGRQTGHAEHTEEGRQRHVYVGNGIGVLGRQDGVLTPAQAMADEVADRSAGGV